MKGLIVSIAVAALLLTTAVAGYSLTAGDGAVIFAANCASCHGADDATIDPLVKKANALQITKAFRLHTSMKNSILRTNVGVTGAGLTGQLTLRQENAIVANLHLYRGEDLYNGKFTDPSQSTWNCSAAICHHGPYDNSVYSGATYNQIVRGFRQNKLHNNMMAPLRSKYTLAELRLIAKALAVAPPFSNSTSGGGGTTSIDGAGLYYAECMGCHNGPIQDVVAKQDPDIMAVYTAGSNGANVIKTAISNPLGGMNTTALTSLTDAEIQAIAVAIQTQALPKDTSIYSSASCFGTGTGPTNLCHQGYQIPPYK